MKDVNFFYWLLLSYAALHFEKASSELAFNIGIFSEVYAENGFLSNELSEPFNQYNSSNFISVIRKEKCQLFVA